VANNVDIVVRAKNEASGPLKQVRSDMVGLETTARASGGAFDSLIGGTIGGMAGGLAIGALTSITDAIVANSEQWIQAAQRLQTVRSSFDVLATQAGVSSESMLQSMRSASRGMVSDADLIASANKAMMLGVADNGQELADLLKVAAARGRAFGMDSAQAFDQIVTGIGRLSPRILDNLGIVMDEVAVFDQYAAALGRTRDQLSETEKRQALLNKVIAESRNLVASTNTGGTASAAQQSAAAKENAGAAIGGVLMPIQREMDEGMADMLNSFQGRSDILAQRVRDLNDILADAANDPRVSESWRANMAGLAAAIALADEAASRGVPGAQSYANALSDMAGQALLTRNVSNEQSQYVAKITASLNVLIEQNNQYRASMDALDPKLDNVRAKGGAVAQTQEQVADATARAEAAATLASYSFVRMASGLSQVQAQAGATMGIIYNLTGAVNQLNAATGTMRANSDLLGEFTPQINGITSGLMNNMGIDEALAKGEDLKRQTADQIDQLRAQGYTTDQIRLILQSNVAETQKWAGSLDAVASKTSTINQEFEDLKGKVGGVLNDALNVDTGDASIDKLLPREDAVNENARRLAAIMNEGLANQPWLEEFRREVPGVFAEIAAAPDARVAAAKIMQDFQAGMRPELIDKDAAKAKVKAMILGEQNMAALAQEIAAELAAEMNIPLSQAMAAAGGALGVKPQADATGGADGAAPTGPDMTGAGASSATSFMAGFEANANGAIIVASIITKMEANYVQLNASGAKAGTNWGAGFMSTVETGVAQPLISLLATLVLPEVVAQLKKNETQTQPP